MKVYVFPADLNGCGYYRLIWPAEVLAERGHDVRVIPPKQRDRDQMLQGRLRDGKMVDIKIPEDADVMVFQRVTHRYLAQAMKLIRDRGIAVVIDMDDDLTCIHPANPAFNAMHPNAGNPDHSWEHTLRACDSATMVTVSTPALVDRYGKRSQNAHVLYNMVPERMLAIPHEDSDVVGWPGAVFSHPTDLQEMGPSIAQLLQAGHPFKVVGPLDSFHSAAGIPRTTEVQTTGIIEDIYTWPLAVNSLGIGVAPLADTKFNAAKSWLKMAEMAAVGVPCIASPRAEYSRLHKLGVGLLAKKPSDWRRLMNELRADPIRREDLSLAGREVMSKLTIEQNAHLWWEAWTEAYARQRRDRESPLARVYT
jgi:hypothetical protein